MVQHSGARFRWLVIGPFLIVVALLAILGVTSAEILSAVRAYVGGESLWSKGQKDAVYHLGKYAASHRSADYQRFVEAIAIPLGDRKARTELERPKPDLAVARRGFLEGGNHPDDVALAAAAVLLSSSLLRRQSLAQQALRLSEERLLEAQLRESQKMEAIGTLAGGIAHDFNDILGAILGNLALARGDIGVGHPALQKLEQITKSVLRAKGLVQQILAFGRRQSAGGGDCRPAVPARTADASFATLCRWLRAWRRKKSKAPSSVRPWRSMMTPTAAPMLRW